MLGFRFLASFIQACSSVTQTPVRKPLPTLQLQLWCKATQSRDLSQHCPCFLKQYIFSQSALLNHVFPCIMRVAVKGFSVQSQHLCFGRVCGGKPQLQLCLGLPFFMRAALGLGMYWLLAWCSSSLLKYWIVLFRPSSSGTWCNTNVIATCVLDNTQIRYWL